LKLLTHPPLNSLYKLNMSFQPTLRRNQLIAPFGVGAIHILKGSRAVVTAGLDFWYVGASLQQIATVKVREPRLEAKLGISHLRLPPGPETELKGSPRTLEIPLFRFPTWYVCPRCYRMERRPLGMDGDAKCSEMECRNEIMRQISFAAVCDHGHLQDFPWKEWIRREKNPSCAGENCQLYYKAGGSGSLADISVECKGCSKRRNLAGIMSGEMPDQSDPNKKMGSSTLTNILLSKDHNTEISEGGQDKFNCQGGRVWLGEPGGSVGSSCVRPMRAVLINATNVHYAQVESALWIPSTEARTDFEGLKLLLDRPEIRNQIKVLKSFNLPLEQIAQNIFQAHAMIMQGFTHDDVVKALGEYGGCQDLSWQEGLDSEEIIRFPEYKQLEISRKPVTSEDSLEIRTVDTQLLPQYLHKIISSISLVDKLRETRVYRGFNRLLSQRLEDAPPPQSHLWRNTPVIEQEKWLPCSVVYGEGIFISFNEDAITAWENNPRIASYIEPLQKREDASARRMGRPARQVFPRVLLLHTLSHLLIRRLVFECGYGSAALRERLYISENKKARMAGILIYTASGDCEGSMGGLVRMGEPAHIARIFKVAIEDSKWCSADPVCTESGLNGGQGIDGLNIASCHCCTLLPETACEFFNCFLDRSIVVDFFSDYRDE
jgi:Domain of unknown function (DUF1998)